MFPLRGEEREREREGGGGGGERKTSDHAPLRKEKIFWAQRVNETDRDRQSGA